MSANIFMAIITALFFCSGVAHAISGNWLNVLYAFGAVCLNVAVMMMGAK